MSKSLEIKIRQTKDFGLHESASADRHGLDHDRATDGLWTRLDVTVGLVEFRPSPLLAKAARSGAPV